MRNIQLIGLDHVPLIQTGDDLSQIIKQALSASDLILEANDIVVITSKIVSKSEGRWADIETVTPGDEAIRVAEQCGKDPRLVELILSESRSISRIKKGVLVTEHRLGFISANAGIDHSNTRSEENWCLLLPEDPERSAKEIRQSLKKITGKEIAVVITDSHGRPFRLGTVGIAIGVSGLPALWDWRGKPDLFGAALQATDVGFADEIAAAAGLVSGQSNEGIPIVIVRGLEYPVMDDPRASDLLRPSEMDLYR